MPCAAASMPAMRWLRLRGAPWDERTLMAAADLGRPAWELRWIAAGGCPQRRLRGRYAF